ncbi:tRNA-binding protein [Cerasibacillus quisquiliarum]|uniref:tRNA-binding protein n=1 Tax=Cerasibacillus quisquiliarum TaxID=227865 RepID=A0A511V335_9BACI|nr:DUF4479 domain-containing protein [Cerasibacillus quisquiliarum]MBB5147579.1 tRNA-binding protein [Cerasibacillus quisquiliarum]GEN32481.1 tRNA-binding protein [Cerasibacillus quisquiliarum]
MDVFYNPKGIGDVLIMPIEQVENRYDVTHESIGPITKVLENDKVIGYNIFQASSYFDLRETGKIRLTEALLQQIKQLFEQYKLTDELDFDLSPKFVVGHVLEKKQHENADKLSVCQVDVGQEVLQIVCGAANVDKDQKVVVAKNGAIMPSGLKIKPTKLRGVQSNGMICSKKELGLPQNESEKGIYVLDDSYRVGEEFDF